MTLTENQCQRILRSRSKCHGEKIRIQAEGFGGNPVAAFYTIECTADRRGNAVIALHAKNGTTADSTVKTDSYEYENGGNLFRAAVRAAKEIATIV